MEAVMEEVISKASKNIVKKIMSDLSDRCGFDAMLDSIDDDTKEEIKGEWEDIIKKELDKIITLGGKS